jgi:protein-S-isoprenylcysteine O-methyltransferase Ste14
VTVKQDHQLIRRGPYTIVRHPIYSGFLLGMLGTALALGQWRGIAGLALAFIGWHMKSRQGGSLHGRAVRRRNTPRTSAR